MSDATMDDVLAAEEHISRLRKSRHFNDADGTEGDANARSLQAALNMLSAQLYSKPTHFILEMLQNADDNTYADGVVPTLTMIYRDDGYLWVGCNEVGFTPANVSAICEISNSTKKVAGSRKGYIGEKGIGFKSVFKVADEVWVCSGGYSFKFKRDDLLGMIVPIPCKFKSIVSLNERTMFCLQIPDVKDRKDVRGNLLALGADLLLFLRKLRHIHVQVVNRAEDKVLHEFSMHREDKECGGGATLTTLMRVDAKPEMKAGQDSFAVFRSDCPSMPREEKREGIKESEVLIAFPVSTDVKTPRRTYNFLPIRDYGLPFVLQADFILTASRQDIIEHNPWNEALKDHACKLFVQSVKAFNESQAPSAISGFKYTWPRFTVATYNASGTAMDGFLKTLFKKYLREEPVLQSQAGDFRSPKSLVSIPKKFCDDLGHPLFNDTKHLITYVHQAYSGADVNALGVIDQTGKEFCAMLLAVPSDTLQQMPPPWHSNLAGALCDINPMKNFHDAQLVQIRDGRWLPCSQASMAFFPDGDKTEIPDGIECIVLDDRVSNDRARKKLMERLGSKRISTQGVCDLILKRHTELVTGDTSLSPECMIAHAWYLFKAKKALCMDSLKLAVQGDGFAAPGIELFMDGPPSGFQMSKYFTALDARFIHAGYIDHGDPASRVDWHRWLQIHAGVRTLPRLVVSYGDEIGLAPELWTLSSKHPSIVWLKLLRDQWDDYFRNNKEIAVGHQLLGNVGVKCKNGQDKALKTVYLPTAAMTKDKNAVKHVDFIDVDDPENIAWIKLQGLGLKTQADLHLCISILREAKKKNTDLGEGYTERLFHNIEQYSQAKPSDTLSIFKQEDLIPVSSGDSVLWTSPQRCRWTAPECLQDFASLADHYPSSLKNFFCVMLKIPEASPQDIIDELSRKAGDMNNIDAIRALLLGLAELLDASEKDVQDRSLKKLQNLKGSIYPVRRCEGEVRLANLTGKKTVDWFIADRTRLQQCFQSKIWIFDFNEDDIRKMGSFLKRTDLSNRYLSKKVVESTEVGGDVQPFKALTKVLQDRAQYLAMLVPADKQRAVFQSVRKSQGLASKGLKLRRHVAVYGSETVFGNDEVGRVNQELKDNVLYIHCPDTSLKKNGIPWPFISKALCEVLELDPSKFYGVLLAILTTSDKNVIKDILEREGLLKEAYVPDELPEKLGEDQDRDDDEPSRPATRGGSTEGPRIKQEDGRSGTAASGSVTDSHPGTPTPERMKMVMKAAENFDLSDAPVVSLTDADKQLSPLELLQHSFTQATIADNFQVEHDGFFRELFVFKLLGQTFDAPIDVWTSPNRERFDTSLPDQGDAPFTFADQTTALNLTHWLVSREVSSASEWLGGQINYHIDVVQMNAAGTAFSFSAAQLELASRWRETGTNVHIVIAVADVATLSPKVQIYVDPLALMLAGRMQSVARGGFYLKAN